MRASRFQPTRSLLLVQMLTVWVLQSAAGIAGSPGQPRILGRPDITVRGKVVFLGDLLRTESLSPEVKARLDSETLGLAPPAGKTKTMAGADVAQKLEGLGITSRNYSIQIPGEIKISRLARILSISDLENIVVQEFLPSLSWKQVQLETLEVPEAVLLPDGQRSFSFECSRRTDLARPFFLTVIISVDGEVVRRLYLRTVLNIEETVAVTSRELIPGQAIGEDDVRWEKRRLGSTLHLPILEMSLLEGKKPRTTIPTAQVLTEDLLVKAPLVKRGDTITLIYQDGKISMKTQAKSLTSGMRGDHIEVMNLDSKKIVRAEILDHRTARVSF